MCHCPHLLQYGVLVLSASRAAINQYLLPAGWAHSSKLAAAAK